jgi:hypothetical protein
VGCIIYIAISKKSPRHKCGFKTASFDITYCADQLRSGAMDFLGCAGFLHLVGCQKDPIVSPREAISLKQYSSYI